MLLRLVKGLSYTGAGYRVTQKDPVISVDDQATAEALLASGYFAEVEVQEVSEVEETEAEAEAEGTPLKDLNKSELETLATYHDISIKGLKSKAAILARILEAFPGETEDSVIEYGSPTMQELQE